MIMDYLEYHPSEWVKIFKSEYSNIHFLVPDLKYNVEHIGATSINSCRSFRNVDILISTSSLADIYTIAMLLGVSEYKELKELSTEDCVVMIKKKKYKKIGVTIRIMEYGSTKYVRFKAFKQLLQSDYNFVIKYNYFREELFKTVNFDITKYNEGKINYIESQLNEHFKFE